MNRVDHANDTEIAVEASQPRSVAVKDTSFVWGRVVESSVDVLVSRNG
jgi:hypothetical protein